MAACTVCRDQLLNFSSPPSVKHGSGTIVIVLPNGQIAASAASDIRFYLGQNELPNNVLEDETLLYPSSDLIPYSFAGFETEVWINRMAGLFRLSQGKAPRVLTIGVDALLRKIIPRTSVMRTSFTLSTGGELNREDLLERLTEAGYNRSPSWRTLEIFRSEDSSLICTLLSITTRYVSNKTETGLNRYVSLIQRIKIAQ